MYIIEAPVDRDFYGSDGRRMKLVSDLIKKSEDVARLLLEYGEYDDSKDVRHFLIPNLKDYLEYLKSENHTPIYASETRLGVAIRKARTYAQQYNNFLYFGDIFESINLSLTNYYETFYNREYVPARFIRE